MVRTLGPDAARPSARPGSRRGSRSAAELGERLQAEESCLPARCSHSGEAHLTGSTRIEDDERREQPDIFGVGMTPGIVELVKDVRVDPTGAPFAVVYLGAPGQLDGDVVGMNLGRNTVEQDAPLSTDAGGRNAPREEARCELLDDCPSVLAAGLLAPTSHLQTGGEQRFGVID